MSGSPSTAPNLHGVPRVGVRLTRSTLAALPAEVARPSYDARELRPGVVHLGMGVFHRAHQAVYFDEIAQRGMSREWGVVGSGMRRCANRSELLSQGGLYTVLSLTDPEHTARVVGVHSGYLSGVNHPNALLAALSRASTRLVTLTVTAAAYCEDADGPSVFALLARALDRRRRLGRGPITVLSCDNLPDGGRLTRQLVLTAAADIDDTLVGWVCENVTFPASMVDRITPPVTTEHRRELSRRFGFEDAALVVAEPYSQWVVQDSFAAGRPPLDEVGVLMVSDVAPFVDMKTRLLNASHLALGYLGGARGHATTAAAMRDPWVRRRVLRLMSEEVAPLLTPVPGVDLAGYQRTVAERLANPAVVDPLTRLRKKGSVRIGNYLAPSLRGALAAGRPHALLTTVVAAWVNHLAAAAEGHGAVGAPGPAVLHDLEDPASGRLLRLAVGARHDVRGFLAEVPGLVDLAEHRTFVAALQHAVASGHVGLAEVGSGVA